MSPLSLLIVTPLDYRVLENNLEQNHAERYARAGCEVTVVYKTMQRTPGPRAFLADALSWRVDEERADGVRLVAVHPPLNVFAGLRRDEEERDAAARSPLKLLALRLLSPLGLLRDPLFIAAAFRAARAGARRYDLCLGIGPWGALTALALRRTGRVRLAVYQDRDYEPGLMLDRLRKAWTAWAERFAMRRSDLVVTTGHRLARLRGERTGSPPEVFPNGVEVARFARASAPPPRRPADALRLVYVGNLIAWSGLELVLEALAELDVSPAPTLTVVGSGLAAYEARLRARVAELGLEDRVEWTGWVPAGDLPDRLARADVGLASFEPSPARRHAFPLKVLEYMAAGLSVLTTRDTEAADLVLEAGCGAAVEFEADAVAAALAEWARDPGRCAELGHRGREHVRAYDWDACVTRQLERMTDALAARDGRA